jgi:ERF superfamily
MNQTNIYQKLQLIQSNIGQLTKTEENKFQKYKYVSEYEILKLLRPLLKEQHLTLTFSDEVGKKELDGQLIVETNNSTDLLYDKHEKE